MENRSITALLAAVVAFVLLSSNSAFAQQDTTMTEEDEAVAREMGPQRPAVTGIEVFSIDMTGDAEVPGPGADGSGTAFVIVHPNAQQICYALDVSGIEPPNAAHIHEGAVDASGGPVVNLDLANRGLGGCIEDVDPELIERIAADPSDFYVNVHNEPFPQGALRGQLAMAD